MYYLKKYISIREIILLSLLLFAGLFFLFVYENTIILIMFFVTLGLIGIAVALFVTTAKAGYKHDFVKQNISDVRLIFDEEKMTVESLDKAGTTLYVEKYTYQSFDKAALLKDKIYLYPGVSTSFYIYPDAVVEGDYAELRKFLITSLGASKFKMKTRPKQFPGYSRGRAQKDFDEKNKK